VAKRFVAAGDGERAFRVGIPFGEEFGDVFFVPSLMKELCQLVVVHGVGVRWISNPYV
jgi:hypothetical protein